MSLKDVGGKGVVEVRRVVEGLGLTPPDWVRSPKPGRSKKGKK